MWFPTRPDKKGIDEVAANDLQSIFKNNKKNSWHGRYFELNEPRTSTFTERNRHEPVEKESFIKESEMVRSTASFPIKDFIDNDIAEETIHYIEVTHIFERPEILKAEEEENLKKADLYFGVDLKCPIHKNSLDPQLLHLRFCPWWNWKEGAPQQFSPVSNKLTERFGLLFAVDRIVTPEKLNKQVVDTPNFWHPGSMKISAESNIIWCSSMRKDTEDKSRTCTACINSVRNKNNNYRWSKNQSTGIDRTWTRITHWFFQ